MSPGTDLSPVWLTVQQRADGAPYIVAGAQALIPGEHPVLCKVKGRRDEVQAPVLRSDVLDIVKVGDIVNVKVLSIDEKRGKIALSMK